MSRKMQSFIKDNRDEITTRINKLHPDTMSLKSMNDNERRIMILNEPTLLDWAKNEGVTI